MDVDVASVTHHIQQANSFADLEHDRHVATNFFDEVLYGLVT
jgi:hypothetical protein